jgi:hypothetical protein
VSDEPCRCGAVVALYLTKELPENKREGAGKYKIDWGGIIVFMIAMIALQIFITNGNKFGWTSWITIVLLTITIVFGYLFIRIEKSVPFAFVDLGLFKNKVFTGATLANFFINGTSGLLIVHTIITWSFKGKEFKTRGLDADQIEAAIKATVKMLNKIELQK